MSILNIQTVTTGLVDTLPSVIYINTSDTYAQVTATGYLNDYRHTYAFNNLQMALVSTSDSGLDWLTVVIAGGDVSLQATGTPGSVILPVVDKHFCSFSGTTGTIYDAGYLPSDEAMTNVAMVDGVTVTGNLPSFSDTAGTVGDSGVPASVVLPLGGMTDGQVIIGSTGVDPVAATLTAGAGIAITNAAGAVTISATGTGSSWTDVTLSPQAMVEEAGYVADTAGLLVFTLPAVAAFGTVISVVGKGAGGWRIDQNAGQNIQVGAASSTVGVGGSVASSNRYDSVNLLCTTANTTWTVLGAPQGVLTIV